MESIAYYNGNIGRPEELSIPFNDRVHFFGDGVYDATYTINFKPLTLNRHIGRFFNSAGLIGLNLPISQQELRDIILNLLSQADNPECLVYWQATRGTDIRNHSFPHDMRANIWVLIKPAPLFDINEKFKTITVEDKRFKLCNVKTLNLLPNILAYREAEDKGAGEAIFVREGRVTECSHSNVSMIKGGCFFTPPADNLILAGVTRQIAIEACHNLSIPVKEEPFSLSDLMDSDEPIITSAGKLFIGISHINGTPVGGKDESLLKKIQAEVGRIVRSEE
ncbi:MAG: aminotransferase class IV [Firmicutes bacterium]|nr:aminotransferase class IV [Bacillota bacterium]